MGCPAEWFDWFLFCGRVFQNEQLLLSLCLSPVCIPALPWSGVSEPLCLRPWKRDAGKTKLWAVLRLEVLKGTLPGSVQPRALRAVKLAVINPEWTDSFDSWKCQMKTIGFWSNKCHPAVHETGASQTVSQKLKLATSELRWNKLGLWPKGDRSSYALLKILFPKVFIRYIEEINLFPA